MVKKIFKRTLSIFMALVLLATTFFIFDPSVLKMDAKAWVDTEANSQGSSLAKQIANAPETIYLKPGSANFQYFSLLDVEKGKAADSKATSGHITFSNPDASNVKLYVNNFWKRNSLSGTADSNYTEVATSNLNLNLGQNITKAGVSATSTSVASGATVLMSSNGGAIDAVLTNASYLNGYEEGGVYIIEWVISYVIKGETRFEFLYTGIYAPKLQLTGVTGRAKHTGSLGNEPSASGFLFVTGAMNYATVGNRSHAFTKKESDFAANATAKPYLAPLIGFVGQKNNGSNYTVPSVSNGHASEANFPTTGTKTVMVCPNTVNEEAANFYFFTDYATNGWGSYASPTGISGSNNGDVSDGGMTTSGVYSGIAYEVVDTSRFTDYNQIPNFSVGFVRYYAKRGGEYAYLDYIRLQGGSAHKDNASLGVQANVDRSEHDEDDDNARTWGLYTLNGPIKNGGTYVSSRYRQDLSGFDRECNLYMGVGLMTTAVDKANIRSAYCEGLKSNIDRVNDSGFSSYYSSMRAQARILCDPTATVNTVSISKDSVAAKQKTIVQNNTASVLYFYVPELIYLSPNDRKTFQYYVDRNNANNGGLRTGENTSGNIYFNVPGATNVSVSCTSGGTATISKTSETSYLATTVTGGSVTTALSVAGTSTIEWTATYTLNGATYTVKAYSVCYAPVVNVASATADGRYSSSYSNRKVEHNTTAWIAGLNEITTSNLKGANSDGSGVYKYQPLVSGSTVPGGSGTENFNSGTGANFFYKSDADATCYGGAGNVYVDTSRYSNLNQIPNLKIGVDINYFKGNGTSGKWTRLGYYRSTSTQQNENAGAKDTGSMSLSDGMNIITSKMSDTIVTTGNQEYTVRGFNEMKGSGNGSTRQSVSYAYFYTVPINKATLRNAINEELSTGRDKSWYTTSSWSTYETALKNAYTSLGAPISSTSDLSLKASKLNEAIAGLVKNTSTAKAKHVSVVNTSKTLYETQSINYTYGDTVSAGPEDVTGYTFDGGFASATMVANTMSNGNSANKMSWDDSTKAITFTTTSTGADNYTPYPGPGASINGYYYVPVTPGSTMTFKYSVTGSSSQFFVFFAGNDRKTLPSSGTWLASNYTRSALTNSEQTLNVSIPSNCYYITFRFGNQTASSTTTFKNFRYTTSMPEEDAYKINNVTQSNYDWTFYYTPNKYDVTYIPDGGTFNGQTGNQTYNDIVTYDASFKVGAVTNGGNAVAAPTKTGYDFAGWKFSLDPNSNKVYSNGETITTWNYDTDTATFTALWTPHKYNIEFDGNTATSGSTQTMTDVVYDTGVILSKNGFVKTGYAFAGWAESATGAVKYADEDEVSNLTATNGATVKLYAKWNVLSHTATAYAYSNSASNATTWSNNANGGTVQVNSATAGSTSSTSIAYGTKYTLTASTAKTGYLFVGWYNAVPTSANTTSARVATTATYQPTMNTVDQKYYARYDIEQYTIYFNKNTSATDTANQATLTNVKYGSTQTVSNPTRTGYTFGGWYAERACTNQVYGTTGTITVKDHGDNNYPATVYAKWTANTINVVYNANGGSGTNPGTHSFAYGSAVTVKNNTFTAPATRTVTFDANGGSCATASLPSTFTFTKWNDKADGTGTGYNQNTAYTITTVSSGTLNLYAQWTQSAVTLPTPTRTGYKFNGWYTAASGGTKVGGAGSSYKPTASTKLYAQWTVDTHDVNVYAYYNTITGTNTWVSGTTGGTVTDAGSYNYGASYSVTATASTSTGYKFVGWYTAAPTNGTTWGTAVGTNATLTATMGTSNVTYYARFDLVYCTVTAYAYSNTFAAQTSWANNATGGTVTVAGNTTGTAGATSSGKVITGKSATLTATPATGYHFVGWYDSTPVSGTATSTTNPLTVAYTASGATKYARFDINVNTLKVDKNDGSTPATYSKAGGQTQTVSNPTRTGYTFGGWTKSPATLNGTLSGTTYTFPSNVYGQTDTLTAIWTANKYNISFNQNDAAATGTMSSMTNCAYDTSYTLTANAFTKTGYTFAGWATSASGSVAYADKASVKNLSATNGATVTLYAKWTINKYKVTLHAMTQAADGTFTESTTGGTVATAGTFDYDSTISITATAKTGYTFAGWFSNSGMTTSVSTVPTKMGAANIEYWAKFTVNKYNITFNGNTSTGGSTAAMNNCVYGVAYTLTANGFTKTGYSFTGWNTNADGSGTAYANKASVTSLSPANSANVVLYAQWTINKYTINAKAMTEGTNGAFTNSATGGTVKINSTAAGATATVTVDYNTALTYTAAAATGYTFAGWYSDSACTTSVTPIAKATANKTYYAKFIIAKYTLTVKGYGNSAAATGTYSAGVGGTVKIGSGTAGATATSSINYNGTATITATPATGYKFDGWYKTVTTGSGDTVTAWSNQYSGTSSEAMTTNRTYYAKFSIKSVTVTYNANGGTNGAVTSATVYYGQALTIGATPTRTGYKLLGWADASNATAATYTTSISDTTINSWIAAGTTKTIYAVWKQFEYDVKLFAAYNTNADTGTYRIGNTGGTVTFKSGVTTINANEDIVSKLTITPAAGYELDEVRYKTVESFPADGNNVTTVGTSWSSAFCTSNAGHDKMQAFNDGSKIAIVAYFKVRQFNAVAYAYSNSATSGYVNNAAGGSVKCGQTGDPGATAQGTAYFGDTNGVTFYATPSTGYTFEGWFNDASFTSVASNTNSVKVILADDSSNANVNKRFAKFSINAYKAYARAKYYTESYDNATGAGSNGIKGGTVTVSTSTTNKATTVDNNAVSIVAKYSELVTYEAKPATGYEFVGWYFSSDSTDNENIKEVAEIDTDTTYSLVMSDRDLRVHAKFVPANFFVILNPNGGTASLDAEITLTYNQSATITEIAKPVRSSYAFVGWSESPDATEATYKHVNSNYTFDVEVINRWYNSLPKNADGTLENDRYEIYAVWEIATYIVTFNDQGGEGGPSSVEVTLGEDMPTITNIPTYEGYKFMGYYTEPGGADESTKYYNADGTSAQKWKNAGSDELYAKWVCPVLKDATYDKSTGKWTYVYEGTSGMDVSSTSTTETLTKQGITDKAPAGAKEVTSADKTNTDPVKNRIKATEGINLNHYTSAALDQLLENVTATNTDLKRKDLKQVELNEYVAKLARYTDINAAGNKDTTETLKPSIKLYETSEKIKVVKNNTLTKSESVIGENYAKPGSEEGSSYVYTNKYSSYKNGAVDYYIYTNSRTPVIALEIDDGSVGKTVADNKASYPTNATITAEGNSSVVPNKANSYMHSAVPATDDINSAWFSKYTKANIGVGSYDYNAKEIVYLTPEFVPSSATSTVDEIVYTITPKDDAYTPNTGMTKSEIANIPAMQADSFSTFQTEKGSAESITVCVCYHNSMNETAKIKDEGGTVNDPYFQLYIDQTDKDGSYADTWLKQMHLYRQSGGANNWEIVMANEGVYPVQDETFKDTGYVLGSFAYVFDATTEPIATSYAELEDYTAAKDAIIKSIKQTPSEKQAAILSTSHAEHFKNGLGFFGINGWSTNFYPKQGSYIYAHMVDRWGNYFNRVWKCFNVDQYTPVITGKVSTGFTATESGGSNIASISIDNADISFLTDLDSSFNDNVFITSGNEFTISTGKPKSKLPLVLTDNAGNEVKGNIPTDEDGNIKFTIEDLDANITDGSYSFMFNGIEVKLYAREPELVRDASIASAAFYGESVDVKVVTSDIATKVQLIENGETRTYDKTSTNVQVATNDNGTLTWTIKLSNLKLGEHTFEVKAKDSKAWKDSMFTVTTNIINKPVSGAVIYDVIVPTDYVLYGQSAKIEVVTSANTTKLQLVLPTTTITYTPSLVDVVDNGDGTLTWTIERKFTKLGANKVTLKAKSSIGWTEEATYGTVDIVR